MAQGVGASKDVLAELFERIGYFFARLEAYTNVSPTTEMTKIITLILEEVLKIFGIATNELKQGSASGFSDRLCVKRTNPHKTMRSKVPERSEEHTSELQSQ